MKRTISTAEKEYINQRTRGLMVGWCHGAAIQDGKVSPTKGGDIFRSFAIQKGWISKCEDLEGRRKVTAAGWKCASAFLKR